MGLELVKALPKVAFSTTLVDDLSSRHQITLRVISQSWVDGSTLHLRVRDPKDSESSNRIRGIS